MRPSDYLSRFFDTLHGLPSSLHQSVVNAASYRLLHHPHGDLPGWQEAVKSLPDVSAELKADRNKVTLTTNETVEQAALIDALQGLHPWRKGPFDFFGVTVDCEWRSDWKWQRLLPHIAPLAGRRVLDVGCGSGYHAWRMWGEGAGFVLGLEPGTLFLLQFLAVKRYVPDTPVWVAPLKMQEFVPGEEWFDSIFSMGVLYHRKEPLKHLHALFQQLRSGGQLVLETLIIADDKPSELVPQGRYAAMRNVWSLPSVSRLTEWLELCQFRHVRCVDVTATTTDEQRSTEWMRFQSLPDFLDKDDNTLTREGYPAPRRAIMIAEKE